MREHESQMIFYYAQSIVLSTSMIYNSKIDVAYQGFRIDYSGFSSSCSLKRNFEGVMD